MLRKYQIDAIVNTITKKLTEKLEGIKKQLLSTWKPTNRQQECLDAMDELQDIAEKMDKLRNKASKIREAINEITEAETGTTYYYYGDLYPSNVASNKKDFINKLIDKKVKPIPSYYDIADRVTVATISAGFDISAWIDQFVNDVDLCEE